MCDPSCIVVTEGHTKGTVTQLVAGRKADSCSNHF